METGAVKRTSRVGACIRGENELNPQHQIFPQGERGWFQARGVNVDDHTVRIPLDHHEALHSGGGRGKGGGWYNKEVMRRLKKREADLGNGETLTPQQILEFRTEFMEEFGFGGFPLLPYVD